jgi:hypothetical protein
VAPVSEAEALIKRGRRRGRRGRRREGIRERIRLVFCRCQGLVDFDEGKRER